MNYKHKSGAQKRKEKEDREKEVLKGQPASTDVNASDNLTSPSSSQISRSLSPIIEPYFDVGSPTFNTENDIASDNLSASSSSRVLPSLPPIIETYFDIGSPTYNIEIDIKKSHESLPHCFPKDCVGGELPISIFKKKLANGEIVLRDWLVWSRAKEALYCLPCKIYSTLPQAQKSALASPEGYSTARKWKKLHAKVPEHESSVSHKNAYVQWKTERRKLKSETSLSDLLFKNIQYEQEVWKEIPRRILDVTLFLAERGLASRGESTKIGDPSNRNFLGILELLAKYDPLFDDHLRKVRHS